MVVSTKRTDVGIALHMVQSNVFQTVCWTDGLSTFEAGIPNFNVWDSRGSRDGKFRLYRCYYFRQGLGLWTWISWISEGLSSSLTALVMLGEALLHQQIPGSLHLRGKIVDGLTVLVFVIVEHMQTNFGHLIVRVVTIAWNGKELKRVKNHEIRR